MNRAIPLSICLVTLSACAHDRERHWIVTWAASPQPDDLDPKDPPLQVSGQTIRQTVHVSVGGRRVRVRLSNAYGATALQIGAAHLALHESGAAIVSGSDRAVTFSGSSHVSIPPGALVVSDPVALDVPAATDLSVSLYLPEPTSATTVHAIAKQTTYVSSVGDFSGAPDLAQPTTTQTWYFLVGLDVEAAAQSRTIVALGDSLTDGVGAQAEANHRWPDFLAARFNAAARAPARAIANAGIAGNRVLGDWVADIPVGPNALARLDRDVLTQPGAKYVIVLEGTNDIGTHAPLPEVSADEIIAGHRQIILRAHALGLKVIGGTFLPCEGTTFLGFYTLEGERKRETINHWIRTSGAYDGIIDFDAAVRDPAHPKRLLPAFDSGDHLHPNDAGYKAMADAVDLSLFD